MEVIADLGPSAANRYLYGSGCIVRGRTVLTAAHVVAAAVAVTVRDPGKREYSAVADLIGDAHGPGPDLALVQIDDPSFELDVPPIGLARVNRDSPRAEVVERCHAVGYPWFGESPAPGAARDTVDAVGVVPVLSKLAGGLLSVQVSVSPRSLPPRQTMLGESEWSGMSGAPVFAAGYLLGVVTEHAPREGQSAIMAVPLSALEFEPAHPLWGSGVDNPAAWWSRLGVSGLADLRSLPPRPRPVAPAYPAALREFGKALHQRMPQLLGREQNLADIAAFATGTGGYWRLVGGAFTGKTALLYETVTVGLPAEVDVVCYFLSRRDSDADSNQFLAAVVPQLAFLCEVDPPPAASRNHFLALWEQAVARAGESRHLLLVVDGLDEDLLPPYSPSVASLLPAVTGGNAHVLVTSRPHPDLRVDMDAGHSPSGSFRETGLEPFEGARELAALARQEIHGLTHGPDADLAVAILGLVTAAAGPVSVDDLATLLPPGLAAPSDAATRLRVRRFVTEHAARSLEPVGPEEHRRYKFTHYSLLEYAREDSDLCDLEYRSRIHQWADQWQAAGWRAGPYSGELPPRYLLDAYPATLASDPRRLVALVSDIGWVTAAIQAGGVDSVLAHLSTARAADPADAGASVMLAVVRGQAQNLTSSRPVSEPGYVLRQLCLQAAELGDDRLADGSRAQLLGLAEPGLVPMWTTRRVSRALSAELAGHGWGIGALAVLPGGQVVSGGTDGRVRVWDPAAAGSASVELGRHDGEVLGLAVLPGGQVVSGGTDGRVRVWDPVAPAAGPTELGCHYDVVTAVAVTPDGRVLSGGRDGRVLVWDLAAPAAGPRELGRHGGAVHALAVLPDGRVVSGGRDRRVRVWDRATPGAEAADLGRHDLAVHAVAVLPDQKVVSGGDDGQVLVWDLTMPEGGPVKLGRHFGAVHAVAVLPDGRVVCGGRDRRVRMWDPAMPESRPTDLGRHDGVVTAVAVTLDGRVVSGGAEGRVRVWDPAEPAVRHADSSRHDDRITALAVGPDGWVVSGGRDGRVLRWDPAAPECVPTELGHHDGAVRAVAVLPDGRVISGAQDRWLLVWDPAAPGHGTELGRHGGTALATLPDGRLVSGGHDGRVLVWNPAGPTELGSHDGTVTAVAVLPDGRVVSSAADGLMLLWDPARPGRRAAEFGNGDAHKVSSVAVLSGGRMVTGGDDGRVLCWEPAEPGSRPTEVGRHHGWVTSVAVLPDERVVSGGTDGRVHVWKTGKEAAPSTVACSAQAIAAGVSRSGHYYLLALGHRGGGISIWRMDTAPPSI